MAAVSRKLATADPLRTGTVTGMRARRFTACLLVSVGLAVVAGPVSPASAWVRRTPVTTAPAAARAVDPGGRPWTLGGQACRLLPTAAPARAAGPTDLVGGEACGGIRPGAPVLTPVGQCTLNFLWRGSDGRQYVGTAGHCLLEGSNQSMAVFPPGEGPLARDAGGQPIGEFAYAALDRVSDFALIRLFPGVVASPEICRFGGPTGIDAAPIPALTPLHYVGRGSVTGSLVPARTQLTVEGDDIRQLTGLGVASPGDSGSPLLGLDGRATGVVVATGAALPLAPTGLFVFSVRIAPEMGRASQALSVGFDLVTAPLSAGVLQP